MKFFLLESGLELSIKLCLYYSCHVLEMTIKTNAADGLLITLQSSPLSKSNTCEVTIALG